jgi:hypothetical protein
MQLPSRMSLDERPARRVILAQAIESAGGDRKLLSQAERDQIDEQARQAALGAGSGERRIAPERFLDLRAQRVIEAVEARHPGLAALQHGGSWQHWLAAGLPLGAIALGVLTDVVANPHRVDLLSLPLLGLVAWNLVMYLLLLGGWLFWPRRAASTSAPRAHAQGLLRWRRRHSSQSRAEAAALFHWRWQRATQPISVQRAKRILHLCAAGWAVGLALSLLARGLVVEYRVGWESTFLDAAQVHAILSVMRLPALLLFPFQPFTVQEVAGLQFSHGGGAAAGARWVFMYVALLVVVVIVPRLLLAAWAWGQERRSARRVAVDPRDPYFQRVLSLLTATRVHLCLVAHGRGSRDALLRILAQEPEAGGSLIATPGGDALRLLDVSDLRPPASGGAARASDGTWWQSLFGAGRQAAVEPALADARELGDVVLHVVGDRAEPAADAPLLGWLGKPVLVLAEDDSLSPAARGEPLVREVLPFEAFARSWMQEPALLGAIARCLPPDAQPGFARLAAAWDQRNAQRLQQSMAAVAEHLLSAARQAQETASGALGVKSLGAAERDAQAKARQAAMNEVVQRLEVSAAEMFSRLRALHRLDLTQAVTVQHELQQKFVVQQAVDLPQAGMAGAASGAAMGASVDLLVGGLTLGAATALGALVGGGAATIAAAWKNRATPAGGTLVQLSDDMLQALTEAALLRYLAVAHHGRWPASGDGAIAGSWTPRVLAAVEAHRARLQPFWTAARGEPEPARLVSALAHELETIVRGVLEPLHPAAAGA